MASGMEMMLKSLGIDTTKMMELADHVKKLLASIDGKLSAIQAKQESNEKLLQELTAWKRQQVHLALNQQSQPPTAQPPANQQQAQPPANQQPQPMPQQPQQPQPSM